MMLADRAARSFSVVQLLFLNQVFPDPEISKCAGDGGKDRRNCPHARFGWRQQARQKECGCDLERHREVALGESVSE